MITKQKLKCLKNKVNTALQEPKIQHKQYESLTQCQHPLWKSTQGPICLHTSTASRQQLNWNSYTHHNL